MEGEEDMTKRPINNVVDGEMIDSLWRIATSLTRNPLDVDDLMQEACIAIDLALSGKSRSWYLQLGKSRMVDWLRKQGREARHASWEQFEAQLNEKDPGNPFARRRRQAHNSELAGQWKS